MKRLVAGRPKGHRSNMWGPPRAAFAVAPDAAPARCRSVSRRSPRRRHRWSRTSARNPVAARRRCGAGPRRGRVHAPTRSVTTSARPGPTDISAAPFPAGPRVRGDEDHTDSRRIRAGSGRRRGRIRSDAAAWADASAGGGPPGGAARSLRRPAAATAPPTLRRPRPEARPAQRVEHAGHLGFGHRAERSGGGLLPRHPGSWPVPS